MTAVIFDLDGTLVDSAPDIVASANALLRSRGLVELEPERLRSFIGNGVPTLVERVMAAASIAVTADLHRDWVEEFAAIYAANPIAHSVLYPDVTKALERLSAQGFRLGICTNKMYALTIPVLQGLAIDGFFASVIGGDTLPVNKPDPAPFHQCLRELGASRAVYVGDSEVDAEMAVRAPVPFVLFTEGYRKTSVALIPHQVAFSDYRQLDQLIDRLIRDTPV